MNYQQLIQGILDIDTNDLAVIRKLNATLQELTDTSTIDLVTKLKDFQDIVYKTNLLSVTVPPAPAGSTRAPMSPRDRFLNRLKRFSNCEGTTIHAKVPSATVVQPYFNRLDMAWFEFGGIGGEYDGIHLGVVWLDDPSSEEITVIPTTSQPKPDSGYVFDVHRVGGNVRTPNNVLYIDKMMSISRKRAQKRNKVFIQGTLNPRFLERIRWGIANYYDHINTLEDEVFRLTGDALPADFATYRHMRFMPVKDVTFDRPTQLLMFRKWDEMHRQHVLFKRPKDRLPRGLTKARIYRNYTSQDPALQALGLSDYLQYYI